MAQTVQQQAMAWFKQEFGAEILAAVKGTPFTLDLLTAIAYQETGYLFSQYLKKQLSRGEILRLCVGDTIDRRIVNGKNVGRSAFPQTKADLIANHPRGAEIFAVARKSLEEMSQKASGYASAVKIPDKFCHGFGIFQYDIQFCKADPDYFLLHKWAVFSEALDKALGELQAAKKTVYPNKSSLTDLELAHVAIAYNAGKFDPAKGLKQGFKNDAGQFYGELVYGYLNQAKALPNPPSRTGPRLIMSRHGDSASAWITQEIRSAEFKDGRFTALVEEVSDFLQIPLIGPDRQPVADILKKAGLVYGVSDQHKNDPGNPRIYVFVNSSDVI